MKSIATLVATLAFLALWVPYQSAKAATMTIGTSDGGTVVTKDFLHNGTTLPDWGNRGQWWLAGTQGCKPNAFCLPGADVNIVKYDDTAQTFTIALGYRPIGKARLEIEKVLVSILGVRRSDLCRLKYYLGTTVYIDPVHGGQNLGFSFCPGAQRL